LIFESGDRGIESRWTRGANRNCFLVFEFRKHLTIHDRQNTARM